MRTMRTLYILGVDPNFYSRKFIQLTTFFIKEDIGCVILAELWQVKVMAGNLIIESANVKCIILDGHKLPKENTSHEVLTLYPKSNDIMILASDEKVFPEPTTMQVRNKEYVAREYFHRTTTFIVDETWDK